MVRTITLNDGKKIPALAWGNTQKTSHVGAEVLKAGIAHVDTAQSYYTEEQTANAIRHSGVKRADVWVTTKLSTQKSPNSRSSEIIRDSIQEALSLPSEARSTTIGALVQEFVGFPIKTTPETLRASVHESFSRLTAKPDLLLIHHPYVPEDGKIGQFWKILEDLVEDGTLAGVSLGVCNFRPQDLEAILKVAKIKPVVNQMEFHPYVLAQVEPLLALQTKYGIVTEAFGPLTPILRHPTGGPLQPVLIQIARRLSAATGRPVDKAAVLLLWTYGKGAVAVSTTGNPENICKLGALEDLPDLTPDEVAEIDRVGKSVHFRFYTEHLTRDFAPPGLPADL